MTDSSAAPHSLPAVKPVPPDDRRHRRETSVIRVPLSEFLHITRDPEDRMRMEFGEHAWNHLKTAHASAQYALAEIGTGALLADLYPDYRDTTFAVLRRGEMKYAAGAPS